MGKYIELTEREFIEMFSEAGYKELCKMAYENMRVTPEFKNDKPYVHGIYVFPCWKIHGGIKWSLTIECNAHKIKVGEGLMAYDFGITKINLSDEDMPDQTLDRYNEIMRSKKTDEST